MIIVPYMAEHLHALRLQSAQQPCISWMAEGHAELLERLENVTAFSGLDGEEVLGCAGVLKLWEGRYAAWAFLSGNCGRRFVAIHRAVKTFFAMNDFRRVEAEVATDFTEGHRWIRMLGFELENPRMRKYFPDGSDASLYVRVN